jgi:AT hook motif
VKRDEGLLTQIIQLDHLAHENGKVATFILLIDIVAFGFELAAVLAKTLTHIPTAYAELLVRDSYMHSVRIVNEMMAELNGEPANENKIQIPPPPMPANDNERNGGSSSSGSDPFGSPEEPPPPPKRKRGRPRKYPTLN